VVCSEQHIILLKADRISLVAFKVNIKPLSGSAQLKIIYTILVGEEKLLCVGNDYNLHDDGFHHGNHDQSQVRTTHMVIRASPAEEGNITGGINWVAPPTQATGYSNITFISGSEVSCRRCWEDKWRTWSQWIDTATVLADMSITAIILTVLVRSKTGWKVSLRFVPRMKRSDERTDLF
jgi:hypothetical protein